MKSVRRILIALAVIWGLNLIPAAIEQGIAAGNVWPRVIPCRIQDGTNRDLFVMTLGNVETPLAQGTYDPRTDTVTLKDGTVKRDYFKDVLGVKYFVPMDKSVFPLPPSGFCTWYYYYQEVNETEVKRNARWIADNLKDYGARFVQVDDGWQGETAEGRHGSRDWTTVDKAFPSGMASLASYIKSLGLIPGIWLAPHGQSNASVVKSHPGVFLFKPDGTSASESWEGKFLVDPSVEETHAYLKDLFVRLAGDGYDYFKIDGQPVVVDEYRKTTSFMRNPGDPETLYRKTIETIRQAIGPRRYLLGCWGIPLEGVGFMNGSRTGGDVVLGWSGFLEALRATMLWYFTHNIVWYADPDTMLLRPPLTLGQARVWASLQGLTGQALMSSDRLMDLSEARLEIMRRVYPATDIRPLDLFPASSNKRLWDLKVSHLGRKYDVVGLFNFDETKTDHLRLDWKEMGIPAQGPVHVFDFWNSEYLGAWEAGMALSLAPTSCRVLTLLPASDRVELISTNRHITQGWVDLVSLNFGPDGTFCSGKSRVLKNDAYALHFAFPRGKNYAIKSAVARVSSGPLPVRILNHQRWATVRIESPETSEVSWDIVFEPAEAYHFPTRAPSDLRVERVGLDGVDFKWSAQYYLNAGYQVYLDGVLLGYTPETTFPLRGLDPGRTYTAEAKAVWDDGTIGEQHKTASLKFSLGDLLPDEISLMGLHPVRATDWTDDRKSLSLGGKKYENGIGLPASSEIEYDLKGLYDTFSALVGLDDGSGADRSIEFIVLGDGKELWRSGPIKRADVLKPVKVSLAGARLLVLRTVDLDSTAQEQGWRRRPQGDWVEARVSGLRVGR